MAFTKSYVTQKGLALVTKLIAAKENLIISGVAGGDGAYPGIAYSDMVQLSQPRIQFQTNQGVKYVLPNVISIPLYFENEALTEMVLLTEIGLYAEDPDEGTVLLAIAPSYSEPLPIPKLSEGRLELTVDFSLILSLTEDVNITLPSSVIYLTKEEADGRYWRIGVKYPATEITETTGTTTEEWQRIQDDRIRQMEVILESGSTAGTTVNKPVLINKPYNWDILNNNGYRDLTTGTIRA